MISRPVFKSSFHVEIVDPEGVYLLSERGNFVLKGALHCRLAHLLDGRHTADEIVDRLSDVPAVEVYYALGLLEQRGYVTEANDALSQGRAAFWYALGLDAASAESRLRETAVSIAQFGAVALDSFAAVLAEAGIRVAEQADFVIALADDYLREGLSELNTARLESGRPWLLVKPVGTVAWIGPVFQPGTTGCWECLAERLRHNRDVASYLERRTQTPTCFAVSRAVFPTAIRAALSLAAVEAAKAIGGGPPSTPDGSITTLDLLTLDTQKHPFLRRPECLRCGDPASLSERAPVPVRLSSRMKQFTSDGGHRAATPEQTLAAYSAHVSPITGHVSRLVRMSNGDRRHVLHVYSAGDGLLDQPASLPALRYGLSRKSCGKGMTDSQARASALCEALERQSGVFRGNELRLSASYRQLGARAIHPNACMLFSEAQYARREEWNARGRGFLAVPEPFDEEAAVEWTPVWSLTCDEFKYVPTAYCYYGYPPAAGGLFCRADSNGNAAGNTLEEAVLQGFMELVERDSVALWWYNRVPRPAVDLCSFNEPYIAAVEATYRDLGRELWVLDLTSDLEIPVFAAVSRRTGRREEDIGIGFGAHFDPRIGLLRALTELNQFISSDVPQEHDGATRGDPELVEWMRWRTDVTVANQPYLAPAAHRPRTRADYRTASRDDLRDDIVECQAIVERRGMEMLVLDQTRSDIGLPVVKVIVPGLRHFWVRFAPGRLYDVPVTLGWSDRALAEHELNQIPMPF